MLCATSGEISSRGGLGLDGRGHVSLVARSEVPSMQTNQNARAIGGGCSPCLPTAKTTSARPKRVSKVEENRLPAALLSGRVKSAYRLAARLAAINSRNELLLRPSIYSEISTTEYVFVTMGHVPIIK